MKILLCLLLLMTAGQAAGQHVRGVEALFRVGYGYSPALEKVKNSLVPNENITFSRSFMLVGWEGNFRLDRAVIGLEGTAAISTQKHGITYSEPFMISAHYRAGYILYQNDKGWMYPSIGTGPAFIMFSTYKMESGSYIEKKNYNLLSPSLDLAMNYDFVLPGLSREGRSYDRIIIGVRTGYIYSFTKNHWRDDDWNRIAEMPIFRNNSYYLTLAVGHGGFVRTLPAE